MLIEQFLVLLLVANQVVLLEAGLVKVALGTTVKDALEVRPALLVLVDLQMLFKVAS